MIYTSRARAAQNTCSVFSRNHVLHLTGRGAPNLFFLLTATVFLLSYFFLLSFYFSFFILSGKLGYLSGLFLFLQKKRLCASAQSRFYYRSVCFRDCSRCSSAASMAASKVSLLSSKASRSASLTSDASIASRTASLTADYSTASRTASRTVVSSAGWRISFMNPAVRIPVGSAMTAMPMKEEAMATSCPMVVAGEISP